MQGQSDSQPMFFAIRIEDRVRRRMGLSFKKTLSAAEQDRPDVAARRWEWRIDQPGHDAKRMIFIDETWSKTNMTRLREELP